MPWVGRFCRKGKHVYAITSVAPLITDDDERGFEYVCCWGFLIDCRDVGIRTCECSNIYNACTSLHVCVPAHECKSSQMCPMFIICVRGARMIFFALLRHMFFKRRHFAGLVAATRFESILEPITKPW